MAYPKEERNRHFVEDWKKGLSDDELGRKYHLTPGGVKALKQRLRAKDPSLYEKGATRKPATQQASKVAEYKKVTYYLDSAMAKNVKRLALERDMDISELVREVLGEYLRNK